MCSDMDEFQSNCWVKEAKQKGIYCMILSS
jgi:hypothetical protein